jgi:hypothetical protein
MDDFKVVFEIPDLRGLEEELRREAKEVWLWAIEQVIRNIVQDAPDGIPVFTGRTKQTLQAAIDELVALGGDDIPLTYMYNPNYTFTFLMNRKAYKDSVYGPPEDAELRFDNDIFLTSFTLNIPDEVFDVQNIVGDSGHKNPQRYEPWDLLTQARLDIIDELKDRLVALYKKRVRSRLKIRVRDTRSPLRRSYEE